MPSAVAPLPDQAVDDAFERLFREHHAFVYRTVYSFTSTRYDAEDVLLVHAVRSGKAVSQ